jgi:hypothetical protein
VITARFMKSRDGYGPSGGWDGHFSRPYAPEFNVANEEIKENKDENPQKKQQDKYSNPPSNQWVEKKQNTQQNPNVKQIKQRTEKSAPEVTKVVEPTDKKMVSVSELEGTNTENGNNNNTQPGFDLSSFIIKNSQVQQKVGSDTIPEASSAPKEKKKLKVGGDQYNPNQTSQQSQIITDSATISSNNTIQQDLQKILNIQPEPQQPSITDISNLGSENVKKLLNIGSENQVQINQVQINQGEISMQNLGTEDVKKILNLTEEIQKVDSSEVKVQEDAESTQNFQNLISKINPKPNSDSA